MVDYWLHATKEYYLLKDELNKEYNTDFWSQMKVTLDIDGYLLWGRIKTKKVMTEGDVLLAGIQVDPEVNSTHVATLTQ